MPDESCCSDKLYTLQISYYRSEGKIDLGGKNCCKTFQKSLSTALLRYNDPFDKQPFKARNKV